MNATVEQFRKKTDKLFNIFDGHLARELEQIIREEIESIIEEYELKVKVVDVILSGSRCRGLEHLDSDLDFIVFYEGKVREDALFNIFCECDLTIAGVQVDINPIVIEKSIVMAEFLSEVDKYLEKSKKGLDIINDTV